MATINFYCPYCNALIRAPEQAWGRPGTCTTCKNRIKVPDQFELVSNVADYSAKPLAQASNGRSTLPSLPPQRQRSQRLPDENFFDLEELPPMVDSWNPARKGQKKKRSLVFCLIVVALAFLASYLFGRAIGAITYDKDPISEISNLVTGVETKKYVDRVHGRVYEDHFKKGKHDQLILIERKIWRSNDDSQVLHAHFKEGKLHGSYKEWDKQGNLVEVGEYVDGKRHDLWKLTWQEWKGAQFRVEGTYNHGAKVGDWVQTKDDDTRYEVSFVNDRPHGEYVMYYPDGKKKVMGFYAHGKESGLWTLYKPEGSVEATHDFEDQWRHWKFPSFKNYYWPSVPQDSL